MHLSHQNKMSRYKKEKNVRLLSCWKKRKKNPVNDTRLRTLMKDSSTQEKVGDLIILKRMKGNTIVDFNKNSSNSIESAAI